MANLNDCVRSFPYPALEDGNLSYPEGKYSVEVERQSNTSVIVNHTINNAAFLKKLISKGQAKYACLVSIPSTSYRRLFSSDDSKQTVKWDMKMLGEPPILRPIIISVAEITCKLGPEDEVAQIWQEKDLNIPKGARLALGSYLRSFSSLQSLLEIRKDESFPKGCFEVEPCSEQGFYFQVAMAPDLYSFIQKPRDHNDYRKSILTHTVGRCLEILQKDYSEIDDEKANYQNLNSLLQELKQKQLPVWSDDGFSPDKVATQLYPIVSPFETDEELE